MLPLLLNAVFFFISIALAEFQPGLSANPATLQNTKNERTSQTILFLGNSLTAGYGLDESVAFPSLIQQRLDSLGWEFRVVNAGLSGETSAGGVRRIDWLLKQKVDLLVLELGGNDALRGIDLSVTRKNLQRIIDKTIARYPDARIVIAGMQVPANLGQTYTAAFEEIFPALARENETYLIPFLLEGVGGIRELNLPDGIHPTAAGHQIVAENVWKVLQPVLAEIRRNQIHPATN